MTTKKERADALAHMTKAELVRTVVKLDRQVAGNAASNTRLLNRIANLEAREQAGAAPVLVPTERPNPHDETRALQDVLDPHRTGNTFPWEQK